MPKQNEQGGVERSIPLFFYKVSFELFDILISPPESKTQRMFDVAVTAPEKPMILYAVFTEAKGANDSIYYLYDSGVSYEICDGGVALMDPKYQLGASFVNDGTIVLGRNEAGTDYIELYEYDGASVARARILDQQTDIENSRNARPIVDINAKAILWHNGYYYPGFYSTFDTSARLYLIAEDLFVTGS